MTTKTAPMNHQQTTTINRPDDGESLLNELLEKSIGTLERTASRYQTEIDAAENRLRKTILTAKAIEVLRSLLAGDVMKEIMRVQNTRLGFLTDKPAYGNTAGGYPEQVVRDCIIEAILKGVYPVNNEFNIIGGNMMIVQNGWRRKLHELPGMDEFPAIQPGDVAETPKYYRIPCTASWVFNGKAGMLSRNVFVSRDTTERRKRDGGTYTKDDFTTIDNLMGKVERKMLEAVFKKINGEPFGIDSSEDAPSDQVEALAREMPATEPAKQDQPPEPAAPPKQMSARDAADLRMADMVKRAFELGVSSDDVKAIHNRLFGAKIKRRDMGEQQLDQMTAAVKEAVELHIGETVPAALDSDGQLFEDGAEPYADNR
jgi:hypothetical protein